MLKLFLIAAARETEKAIEMTKAAKEEKLRQKALAEAAIEEAKVIKTLADAEAYRLRETQKAGELKLRLDNERAISQHYAEAMANMKSPEILVLGGSAQQSNGDMETLVQFKAIEQVKALSKSTK